MIEIWKSVTIYLTSVEIENELKRVNSRELLLSQNQVLNKQNIVIPGNFDSNYISKVILIAQYLNNFIILKIGELYLHNNMARNNLLWCLKSL